MAGGPGGADAIRLNKELRDLVEGQFETSGVKAAPADGTTLSKLRGFIRGPKDTAYEGGLFELDIDIPRTYPFEPPKIKFVTQIWHPNISSQTGAICLDVLKMKAWTPALTIKTALLSISALLSAPEPDDPQDAEVASQYKRNREEWFATARYWTSIYASPTAGSTTADEKVGTLVAMGFDAAAAALALRVKGGDLERAVEHLMSSA